MTRERIYEVEEADDLNIRLLLQKAWYYKYWILASVVAFGVAAWLFMRYSNPTFASQAKIIVRDDQTSGAISEEQIFQDLGMFSRDKNVLNEMAILKSQSLMESVVRDLNLHQQIIRQGNIKDSEAYTDPPIQVDSTDLLGTYELQWVDQDQFLFGKPDNEEKQTFYFDSLQKWNGSFLRISKTIPQTSGTDVPLLLKLNAVENTARGLSGELNVDRESSWASIINLKIETNDPDKSADILNTLIDNYIARSLQQKNQGYRRTLEFIEERIQLLTEELGFVESEIEQFKERNRIAGDPSETVGDMTSRLSDLEKRKSQMEIRTDILQNLEDELEDPEQTFRLLPASLTPDNQAISQLVGRYNELILERSRLRVSAGEENPVLDQLESQIIDLKSNILENIDQAERENQFALRKVDQEIKEVIGEFRTIPGKERELLEIVRQQQIKENLYLYLLEKREEIALTMSMSNSNVNVIEQANASRSPVYPRGQQVYGIAISLGLILPILIIYLIQLLDNKIRSRDDVKAKVQLPVVGEILENKKEKGILIADQKGQAAEMFRLLRTNVNFLLSGNEQKHVMVTSYESGEGKTYIAANLALTFSTAGKKVALLGLDLRKPKLHDYFGWKGSDAGITNYILGDNELKDIIRPSGLQDNLDVILSGVIPPNPAELLLTDRFKEAIQALEEEYDLVIWDTAPVGLVSDTLSISKLATCSLFVVKQGFSHKKALDFFNEEDQERQLPSPAIVLNGIKEGSFYGYGKYRYGYGRYNKGYYN